MPTCCRCLLDGLADVKEHRDSAPWSGCSGATCFGRPVQKLLRWIALQTGKCSAERGLPNLAVYEIGRARGRYTVCQDGVLQLEGNMEGLSAAACHSVFHRRRRRRAPCGRRASPAPWGGPCVRVLRHGGAPLAMGLDDSRPVGGPSVCRPRARATSWRRTASEAGTGSGLTFPPPKSMAARGGTGIGARLCSTSRSMRPKRDAWRLHRSPPLACRLVSSRRSGPPSGLFFSYRK